MPPENFDTELLELKGKSTKDNQEDLIEPDKDLVRDAIAGVLANAPTLWDDIRFYWEFYKICRKAKKKNL